jgi:GTP-binding protein Era
MQRRVERELAESDAALLVLNGQQEIGPGDRFTARAIAAAGVPHVVALNKVDLLTPEQTLAALAATEGLGLDREVFPVSARTGEGVPELAEALTGLLPEGPFLYPPEETTDLPPRTRVAELIREQALRRVREEIPHALEVEVDEVEERDDLVVIRALMWAETESQKGILIGAGGQMVRAVGTGARRELEVLLGRRVHLDLSVRVRRGWRRDDALLDRLGIE